MAKHNKVKYYHDMDYNNEAFAFYWDGVDTNKARVNFDAPLEIDFIWNKKTKNNILVIYTKRDEIEVPPDHWVVPFKGTYKAMTPLEYNLFVKTE